jgi:hypothetical protein
MAATWKADSPSAFEPEVEPQPRALAVLEVVIEPQRRGDAHAGEAVNHDTD